jgi:hypothetical protein
MFFHFVPVGNTIWTTFSHEDNVLVLWGIASANGTMMVESVAKAWSVGSMGFFVPELPWNRDRRPNDEYFLKPRKVSLGDGMDGIPRGTTHFHILEGHHLMPMGIKVQISVDLEFLCRSHTEIGKPHLLTQRLNFFTRKKLATSLCTIVLGGHETDRLVSQYAILAMLFILRRRATRIISTEAFARTCVGNQGWLNFLMPSPMIPQAYSFMENPTKRPSAQGKPPSHRDLKSKQRIQDAHPNIIGTKGIGINTITGIGVSTYAICHRHT